MRAVRGEQRRHLKRSESWEDRIASGGGDCIDCGHCVHVCPTGVDIRDGNQLECIGCGLCVDACNEVMAKIGRPGELITFDTHNNQLARANGEPARTKLIRPRTIVYALVLLVVSSAMFAALVFRPRLDISVLRDRAPLFVVLSSGDIRNGYTFKISNMTRERKDYGLTFSGVANADISVVGLEGDEHVKPETVGKAGYGDDLPDLRPGAGLRGQGCLDAAEVRTEGSARRRNRDIRHGVPGA